MNTIIDVDQIARRLRQQRQAGSNQSVFATILAVVLDTRNTAFFAAARPCGGGDADLLYAGAGRFLPETTDCGLSVGCVHIVGGGHGRGARVGPVTLDHATEPSKRVRHASPIITRLENFYNSIVTNIIRSPAPGAQPGSGRCHGRPARLYCPGALPLTAIKQTEVLVRWLARAGHLAYTDEP